MKKMERIERIERLFEVLCKACLTAAVVLLMAVDSEHIVSSLACFTCAYVSGFVFYRAAVFMHDNY